MWVVNAYMLTFGGFLLLGGRLGDLFGHRKLFLIGLTLFTVASLACGLASSQNVLIAARAVQGLGGAVVDAVALSLIMDLFTEPADRAKAMGIYGFVCAAGGSIGTLLGGVLTDRVQLALDLSGQPAARHSSSTLFVCGFCRGARRWWSGRLDVAGALTITAVLDARGLRHRERQPGWLDFSSDARAHWDCSRCCWLVFLAIEARVRAPLMPLRLFPPAQSSPPPTSSVSLWAAAMFAWFFISALYMQLVLGYSPLQVGLAFLPANLIMAAFSLGLSARLVMRFGIRGPIADRHAAGRSRPGVVRACAAGRPISPVDVLPGMLMLGLGAGMALNPVLLAAMNDVSASESGLASGVVNTSFMMGGALGLAVLASVAAAHTGELVGVGADSVAALAKGYGVAFGIGAAFALAAAILSAVVMRARPPAPAQDDGPAIKAFDHA